MEINKDFEIKNARVWHLNEIARIERENFPCPWKREYFENELFLPQRFNKVIVLKGEEKREKVIAYIFSHYMQDELHIAKIATDKRYQRRGFSKLLMEDCISFCRRKKISEITLEVRVSNLPAIKFYEKFNFEKVYIRKRYYPDGEDAFFMLKVL